MSTETASSVIRAALSTDISLTGDQLIEQVKAAGIKASPQTVKNLSYNIRGQLRKAMGKPAPAKAAARKTAPPKPRSTESMAPVTTLTATMTDLTRVLANVALVNKVVGLVNGPENVRQVVDAVRACGGVEAFLQHLDLVAGIREDGGH